MHTKGEEMQITETEIIDAVGQAINKDAKNKDSIFKSSLYDGDNDSSEILVTLKNGTEFFIHSSDIFYQLY